VAFFGSHCVKLVLPQMGSSRCRSGVETVLNRANQIFSLIEGGAVGDPKTRRGVAIILQMNRRVIWGFLSSFQGQLINN
jgi:hypothetical protein